MAHLDENEVNRLINKYPLNTPIGRIRLLGEYLSGITGAVCYYSFNRDIHIRPQTVFYPRKPLCLFIDFNVEPMCMGVGQRDGDLFRVYKEIILETGNIPQIAEVFKQTYPSHGAEIYLYGDASGKSRTSQTGMNDYQTFLSCMKNYPAPILLKVPEKNPPVNERLNTVNLTFKDEYGQSNVEIDPSCTFLVEDLELVVRDSKGGIKKSHNKKDSYYIRTHISDALGYWLTYDNSPNILVNAGGYTNILENNSINIPKPQYFKGDKYR